MFAILKADNLKSVFACCKERRDIDLLLGTDCSLAHVKELPGRVYFKAVRENEVIARAELTGILDGIDLPDSATRLPGFERTPKKWYYAIRHPQRLDSPIPVTDFTHFTTRKKLRNDAQKVQLVFDPDPSLPVQRSDKA